MRAKATFRLPPDLTRRLADYAMRKRVSQAVVVEAALESYLSADGPDRLEAALARRLDRLSRASERLERHVTIGNEALALFVRFWLTNTSALSEALNGAAQAKGRERYDGFVQALGRRLAAGKTLAEDMSREGCDDRQQTDQ
jgi:predicted transcriptional regulator